MTTPAHPLLSSSTGRRWLIGGHVQGVGFRPFVRSLALRHGLRGLVRNHGAGVEVLAQGDADALDAFAAALLTRALPPAAPRLITCDGCQAVDFDGFVIADSISPAEALPALTGSVLPDQAVCADCRHEISTAGQRRYRYPFTSCTHCGPRYSTTLALPFDRSRTTLAAFPLCPSCRSEYDDPADRRHHAQTLGCPDCGPRLTWHSANDDALHGDAALDRTIEQLRDGAIVAIKGVSGYHLCCVAGNRDSIDRLRRCKPRPDKPLAVMFPHGASRPALDDCVELDAITRAALADPAGPIVLVSLRPDAPLPDSLAPALGTLGVLLPYSPLHHLLLAALGAPLVVTSANPRGEPVLTDADMVEGRLAGVADGFLHHDREIRRAAEDPVRRVIAGRVRSLRPGRGDAPLELRLDTTLAEPWLAVGGQQKNTIALAVGDRVLLSPEIPGLDTPRGRALFEDTINGLQALYGVQATRIACDAHPGYASHRWARASGLPVTEVRHHTAHAAAVTGEAGRPGPWLVFTWDGLGLGADGTLWGGEALHGGAGSWRHVAGFRPFRVPGGERAGREPWRSALALCLEQGLTPDATDWPADSALVIEAWRRDINCPAVRSVGRLFDAAAALIAGDKVTTYEAQGPMRLEALATLAARSPPPLPATPLPLRDNPSGILEADWAPLLTMMRERTTAPADRAFAVHATLAATLLEQARVLQRRLGPFRVGLAGGVFQNRLLSEQVITLLAADGFEVHLPSRVPCNDAGIAFGQIVEVAARCRT